MSNSEEVWDVAQASDHYRINKWGDNYFGVNPQGNISVRPIQEEGPELDLIKVVEEARSRGLSFPLLLRFQDLLRHRVKELNETFRSEIKESGYQGEYRGVFPIKVNQLREVVEEIMDAGEPYHYGLEAGSKPELFAALALHSDKKSLIICNGYKDPLFIQMALLGRKLEKTVILVVEKLEEVAAILDISENLGVKPIIGIRVRLQTKGGGKWATSGGENAKFGLSTNELLEALELISKRGAQDCLQLLHFHIGSQVPDIQVVKRAVREATRFYAKLHQMGFPLTYLDVGGGLGIDYDGTHSACDSSTNYTLSEYVRDVVYSIKDICEEEKVPHPTIVSESGRSIVAHHSMLIVDVIGIIEKTKRSKLASDIVPAHPIVKELLELRQTLNKKNRREHFHDAVQLKDDALVRFELGLLDLQAKAQVESLYWEIAEEVEKHFRNSKSAPPEIKELSVPLGDQFICNFSLFQSMIDHWALGQLFPVVPIHRLNEAPLLRGSLADITCDSDGKISKFIDGEEGIQDTLALHVPNGSPYYLGLFLMGAYQDVMGDLHNLFGRVNEAHIFLDADEENGFYIEETLLGDSIEQVLAEVQYDASLLERLMKTQIDAAIKSDVLKPNEGMRLLESYEQGLRSSTYLKF